MNKFLLTTFILAGIAAFNSCVLPYPDDNELYQDVATISRRDATVDFSKFSTYSISDTVFFVDDDSTVDAIEAQYSTQLVTAVVNHMNSRGYTRVDKTADPDLLINMSATESLNIVYYPGYGYDYWDCYYWGYYCGWYYYPTYPTISTYKSGSLVIDMVNIGDALDGNLGYLPIPWTSVIYALSSSDPSFNVQKALQGIDEAFAQSPYLTK